MGEGAVGWLGGLWVGGEGCSWVAGRSEGCVCVGGGM